MGFQWLGDDLSMERLRQLEGECRETRRELAQIQKCGAAGDYEELSRRLAAIAAWVRASLINGGPLLPPEEPEEPEEPDKPDE